jgi:hypothetical protein
MATSEILGLFQTPEQYSAGQDAAMQRQFLQRAVLDPFQKASVLGQQAGYSAAQGIGGALGGTDPQLEMISRRNVLLGQLNPSDPKSYAKVAEVAARIGDSQFAVAIAQEGRKAESEMALTLQRNAAAGKERQMATPNDIQIANELATLQDTLDQLNAQPASAERDRAINMLTTRFTELTRLSTKVEKEPRYGVDREAIAGEMFENKSFAQLTPTQKAAVNKRVEDEQGRRARESAPKIYAPGQPIAPKDWMDFSKNILSGDPVMQRTSTILSDAPSAIDIIRSSTSNDFAAASLPSSIARLTGEGKNMSNADVNRFARTGGLDDRLAQDAVKFFTGGTTEVKKDQAEKFAIALYRGALIERKKKLETAAEEFGYSTSPNYKSALKNIDDQLSQFKLVKQGESIPRQTTQSDDDLINKYAPAGKK